MFMLLVARIPTRNPKSQIPSPKQISIAKFQKSDHWLFEIIAEKIRVNSRASAASRSRAASADFSKPTSINRRNNRLSCFLTTNLYSHYEVLLAECLIG